jgi:hypothetical protein
LRLPRALQPQQHFFAYFICPNPTRGEEDVNYLGMQFPIVWNQATRRIIRRDFAFLLIAAGSQKIVHPLKSFQATLIF